MKKLNQLKGFILLNEQEVTTIQGGNTTNQCSTSQDVDSKKNDSYSGDKKDSDTCGCDN